MTPLSVRFSISTYQHLLLGYPPPYRARFAREMSQVFCLLCHEIYGQSGPAGLVRLWLPELVDWAWSAVIAWTRYFKAGRRNLMADALDSQVGDMTWSITTGLRAGYNLREVITALAGQAPEPAASACRLLLVELEVGQELGKALVRWQNTLPSAALARLASALAQNAQAGTSLAEGLDTLSDELVRECGSDPAFYAAMRQEAGQLGAKVPERAANHEN